MNVNIEGKKVLFVYKDTLLAFKQTVHNLSCMLC